MARESKLTIDMTKLESLRRKLGTGYVARVGVLGANATATHAEAKTSYDTTTGKAKRTKGSAGSLSNSDLAMIHEMGSYTHNIPPRSFLRMPIEEKMEEIVKMLRTKQVREMFAKGDTKGIFGLIAIKAESIVQRAFETAGFGHWEANKPATVKAKGSSSPLIDTAQLRQSITSDVVKSSA